MLGGTVVEHLTDTPKNKGSNLATGSRTEKMAKSGAFRVGSYAFIVNIRLGKQ